MWIKETNYGYISFETKEDAEAWLDDPDDTDVHWTETEVISRNLVHEPD